VRACSKYFELKKNKALVGGKNYSIDLGDSEDSEDLNIFVSLFITTVNH
jgi:hypothetical protein